jgi:hypothetical protein
VSERRFIARRLALELLQRADALMYDAKAEGSVRIHLETLEIRGGALLPPVPRPAA